MTVTVYAGSWAQRYLNGAPQARVEIGESATALEAALMAGLPRDEIGMMEVGGQRVEPDAPLGEGQVLRVYPSIIGG